jgi:hypothetical protein
MTAQEILTDIHALEEELLDLERKYGVRSEIDQRQLEVVRQASSVRWKRR